MPEREITAREAVDRYGFPVYARLYAVAEERNRTRKRIDVATHIGLTSLADIIKSAINAGVGVAGAATKMIDAVRDAGLRATAPIAAGYSATKAGLGAGVGAAQSAMRRDPPLDSYEQIEDVARQFRDTAFRQLPCMEPRLLDGEYISAWSALTEKQLNKSSATAIAKEAAHQMDMLGRAWNQLAEVAEKPENKDSRGGKPKWRKCRIASEVAGAMAWFRRKYVKSFYFHDKLVEDYCAVGGVFHVMEKFWRDNSSDIVTRALVSATQIGAAQTDQAHIGTSGNRAAVSALRGEIEAEARRRMVQGSNSGHLSSGTTNWRG